MAFSLFVFSLYFTGCLHTPEKGDESQVNTAHLDHLYEEIAMADGDSVGIVHIYSEFPGYDWVGDDDEGIACVDDAARAAIFYLRHYTYTGDEKSHHKSRMLLRFILNMQAENGYFHNFIWPNHTINTAGKTSGAWPDWWSWRALWALGEARQRLDHRDPMLELINRSTDKLIRSMLTDFPMPHVFDTIAGMELPAWLPHEYAADQGALILIGLSLLPSLTTDSVLEDFASRIAEGIMHMQVENDGRFPHGAFLSWQNIWHAYGNSQAYALFRVSDALDNALLRIPALEEADIFFPALWDKGGLSHFIVRKNDGDSVEIAEEQMYPQIAYGMRPVIWSCLEAFGATGDEKYLEQAQKYSTWFSGDNAAKIPMYDPGTGRGYDGLVNANEINRNAGAESTIEALLALQEMERMLQIHKDEKQPAR